MRLTWLVTVIKVSFFYDTLTTEFHMNNTLI